MAAVAFDTLKFVEKLEAGGVPEEYLADPSKGVPVEAILERIKTRRRRPLRQ